MHPAKRRSWPGCRALKEPHPIVVDATEESRGRTQRQTMALKNVRYRLHARIRPHSERAADLTALEAQFRRRAARGQCFTQPCFGCREFPAYFRLLEPGDAFEPPVSLDLDVGWMVYDTFDALDPGGPDTPATIQFFQAAIQQGTMQVPGPTDPAVRRPVRAH